MSAIPGIYAWDTGAGGVHHYRMAEPLRVAAVQGVGTGTGRRLDDEIAERYDTILVHMLWQQDASEGWSRLAAGGNHRLVFDIDDAMWDPDFGPFHEHYTPEVLERVWRNMRLAHVITTPSPVIAEYVTRKIGHPNVWICRNTIPQWVLEDMLPAFGGEIYPTIGYQGSPSHAKDWTPQLQKMLIDLCRKHDWRIVFYGPQSIPGWPEDIAGFVPWQSDLRRYYASLRMDIGIGPLARTAFNRAKSGIRAAELAALGIPSVLSDTADYRYYTASGAGRLVSRETVDDWRDALTDLMTSSLVRARMTVAGRTAAHAWTTEACIGAWYDAWNSV